VIREATSSDAAACAAIYEPYVRETAITFETEAPDTEEFVHRIATAQERHAWLVAEQDGEVVGYAYAGALKPRAAYALSCETTVYLREGFRRTGLGRALTEAVLARVAELGMVRAFACIALPNEASIGLHHALGFRDAGVWERAGFKHDAWWDVAWLQRDLT
jgi:phosphinothricin acetyltransferase